MRNAARFSQRFIRSFSGNNLELCFTLSNAILTRFNPAAPEALAIDGARRRMRQAANPALGGLFSF